MSEPPKRPEPTERPSSRLAEIRADISARLWPINAGMSSEDFNQLMDQMSQLQWNFELRAAANASGRIDTRAGAGDRRRSPQESAAEESAGEDPPPE